jgi:hypothetical protein
VRHALVAAGASRELLRRRCWSIRIAALAAQKQAVLTSQDTTRLQAYVDGQDQAIRSRPPGVGAHPRLLSVEQVIERIEELRSLIPERVAGDG